MVDNRTIDVYDEQSQAYAEFNRHARPEPRLLDFMARLPMGACVLDLGCGPGQSAALLHAHGLRVDAVDASAEMVKLANTIDGVVARQARFEDIDNVATFDAVWANFSLLHAPAGDFPGILGALHTALKPRGLLHIGMKLGTGETRDALGRLYTYYTREALCDHLQTAGFGTLLAIHEGEERGLAGTLDKFITILSQRD